MAKHEKTPICGLVAYSGTGKTSLLEKLIPLLSNKGIRVGLIKHAHHQFDIDHPGKDSYRLRKAGAIETMVASKYRWALIHEEPEPKNEPDLGQLVSHLNHKQLDLILVEGFKHEIYPRIELHRASLGKPFIYTQDKQVVAIAHDGIATNLPEIPNLDINNPHEIMSFIIQYFLAG